MTAVFSLAPLMEVTRTNAPQTASLRMSLAYDVFAPVSNVLDALTLLSPAQYWATFALCAAIFFGLWAYGCARSGAGFAATSCLRAALGFMGGTLALVGVMLVANRPMASLALADRDLIAVDFHSHTDASHDGRPGFDAEKNREWHASSGFDAAYVTDHMTFDGALTGLARNPARSGDATVLLPGVELRDGNEHPILIGVDPRRMRITSPDWEGGAVKPDGGPVPPMLLLSVPGDIVRIPSNMTDGPVRLAGIEAVDGSPRGMAQAARDRDAILALARNLHLAVLSASDNHGWGRTAPAWSILRIPGWRDMTPPELDIAIRRTIITHGFRAIEVIARRTAGPPQNRVEAGLGGIAVALVMLRTMSLPDRFSWLVWSWGLCIVSLRNARRNSYKRRARARKRATRELVPVVEAAA
jgi:hypothetical protein